MKKMKASELNLISQKNTHTHSHINIKKTLSNRIRSLKLLLINYAFFFVTALITRRATTRIAIDTGRTINAFGTKPASK